MVDTEICFGGSGLPYCRLVPFCTNLLYKVLQNMFCGIFKVHSAYNAEDGEC